MGLTTLVLHLAVVPIHIPGPSAVPQPGRELPWRGMFALYADFQKPLHEAQKIPGGPWHTRGNFGEHRRKGKVSAELTQNAEVLPGLGANTSALAKATWQPLPPVSPSVCMQDSWLPGTFPER